MQSSVPAAENRIRDIQVLRGVSILFVLFYHLSITPNFLNQFPNKITNSLHVGVQIFFLLSGYVVTRSLTKDDFHGPRFFIRRLFRLLPAIFVFLAITTILNFVFRTANLPQNARENFSVEWSSFGRQALGVAGGYFNLLGEWYFCNGAIWSLSVEDQFYGGVAAVVTVLSLVWKRRPKIVGKAMLVTAGGLYSVVTAYRVAAFLDPADVRHFPHVIRYMGERSVDFILLGVVSAFFSDRLKSPIERHFKESGPFLAASLTAAVLGLLAICESPISPTTRHLSGVGLPLSAIMIAAVVLLSANNLAFPSSRGIVYRSMEYLGDRSYTYYLFHFPIFAMAWLIFYWTMPRAFEMHGTAQLICCTVLLVPLCEVVFRYVELPCMRRGRALAERMFPRSKAGPGDSESQPASTTHIETPLRRAA